MTVDREVGVVLTAGAGSRMHPLNQMRPKALMPVCNRPLLQLQLDTLVACSVRDVLIAVDPRREIADRIAAFVDAIGATDSYRHLKISLISDTDPTAFSFGVLRDHLDGAFYFLSCDGVRVGFPHQAFREFHRASGSLSTRALSRPPTGVEAPSWDIAADGRLVRYDKARSGGLSVTGIVLCEREFLDQVTPPYPNSPYDFGDGEAFLGHAPHSAAFLDAAEVLRYRDEGRWYGFATDAYCIDAGTPERYRRANFDFLRFGGETLAADGYVEVAPSGWQHPSATVHGSVVLTPPFLIGGRAEISAEARIGPDAVIGAGCAVGKGAAVTRSVLWDQASVAAGSEVQGAIVADGESR